MSDPAAIYKGEALVKRWGDSSSALRTVTLQLEEDEPLSRHPFFGFDGRRVMVVVVPIENDGAPSKVSTGGPIPLHGAKGREDSLTPPVEPNPGSAVQGRGPGGGAASGAAAPPKPKQKWAALKPSAQAAIRCDEEMFQRWLGVADADLAACEVRRICRVASRSELDANDGTNGHADLWRDMDDNYFKWLRAA